MDLVQRITEQFIESIEVKHTMAELLPAQIATAAELMVSTLMSDHKILICGNAGSAANAQHFASEMVGRFEKERPGLAAIALTTDSAMLTAIASEYDFDLIFSKQIRALGQPGDILLLVTSSGRPANLIEAIHAAHERHITVIALTGRDGGEVAELLKGDDILLNVPTDRGPRIQETHLLILHALCDAIDFYLLDGE
ncbi:phosphoheptose isomerase [Burkholderiaceae bacterium DAT-1]|nr:phosphoheptose isomerase [Burkholderiaceae bacterium DAT-1]